MFARLTSRRVFLSCLSLMASCVVAIGTATVSPALAASEALLLIEAESGQVLHAENATHPWYPASLTKLMTSYVALQAIRAGKLTPASLLTVSQNAAAQAPSKMGFPPGTEITLDNALKMLMVKSANDIAVVVAEGVSGSVENFADDMNRAALALGMTQTYYVNPHGLPDDRQVSSARDQAILARALLLQFPEHEIYWRLPAIKLGNRVLRNYNTLIDRYPGADGMKTGFICASGFNLVGSATRNNKRLIVVVLGAPSSPVRAVKAASLLERGFAVNGPFRIAPSLGRVDSLAPVNFAPADLREAMCGKQRTRPAAESEDMDDDQIAAANVSGDSGAAQGFRMSALGEKIAKPSSLLGPLQPSMPPVVVFTGPKNTGKDGLPVANAKPQAKPQAKPASAKPADEKPAAAKPVATQTAAKPATAKPASTKPATTEQSAAAKPATAQPVTPPAPIPAMRPAEKPASGQPRL